MLASDGIIIQAFASTVSKGTSEDFFLQLVVCKMFVCDFVHVCSDVKLAVVFSPSLLKQTISRKYNLWQLPTSNLHAGYQRAGTPTTISCQSMQRKVHNKN